MSEAMTIREASKAARRQRIVDGAATLIQGGELATASVRRIAEVAEVSPATIYNLVGSRDDVFDAVFDSLVGEMQGRPASSADEDSLAWLVGMASDAVGLVTQRADLFRPLMADRAVGVALRDGPRLAWARSACDSRLRVAVEQGMIDVGHESAFLARLLVDVFINNFVRWAIGEVDDAQFARHVRSDAASILRLAATDAGSDHLTRLGVLS